MELIVVAGLILLVLFVEIKLYWRYGLRGLSYRCRFSSTEVTEGETITFTEIVENDKALPVPWLKAELTLPRWLDFPESHCTVTDQSRFVTEFFSVRGHARVSRVWKISCEKRGVYAVEHVVLVTSDLLGAVRLSLPAEDLGDMIVVLPRRYTDAGLLLPHRLRRGFGEHPVRQNFLTDPFFSAGVREYTSSDPWNRIHWKVSAHAGKLLVRKEEYTAQQTMTILLGLETSAADSGQLTRDTELQEHTIRVCVQCLWEALQNGFFVRLCVAELDAEQNAIVTGYGSGRVMYQRCLEQLALLKLEQIQPMHHLLHQNIVPYGKEPVLLITPYTDVQIATWKAQTGGLVLVTGHAHDAASCADRIVPQPGYTVENGGEL